MLALKVAHWENGRESRWCTIWLCEIRGWNGKIHLVFKEGEGVFRAVRDGLLAIYLMEAFLASLDVRLRHSDFLDMTGTREHGPWPVDTASRR